MADGPWYRTQWKTCPVCKKSVMVRLNGKLYAHGWKGKLKGDRTASCEGTGTWMGPLEEEEMPKKKKKAPKKKAPEAKDPIHFHDAAWWFWNETWNTRIGPYPTWKEADRDLKIYCRWLEGVARQPTKSRSVYRRIACQTGADKIPGVNPGGPE